METIELVKALFDSTTINNGVDSMTEYIITVCPFFLPLFFGINMVWSFAKNSFLNLGEKPKFFEKANLIRAAVLWMLVINQ